MHPYILTKNGSKETQALDDLGSGLPFGNFVLGGREGLREQGLSDGLQFTLLQESVDGRF